LIAGYRPRPGRSDVVNDQMAELAVPLPFFATICQ